jgi:hypothetical protein
MACATTVPSTGRVSLSTLESQYPLHSFHDIIAAEYGNEEDEGRPDRR